jgi:hypothetical protein
MKTLLRSIEHNLAITITVHNAAKLAIAQQAPQVVADESL